MKKSLNDIPDKLFFRISEVAKLAGVEPYVLRFWESEFTILTPEKNRGGWRVYRRKDVERILEIKRLLYEEGYTIEGARRKLSPRHSNDEEPPPTPQDAAQGIEKSMPLFQSKDGANVLKQVRQELESILTMLNKR